MDLQSKERCVSPDENLPGQLIEIPGLNRAIGSYNLLNLVILKKFGIRY
jgi:hypothetical protein